MPVVLSLLEFLAPIVANLVSAKNPAYKPLIDAASGAITNEVSSIQAGNPVTPHAIVTVAAPLAAIGAEKAISNSGNATTQNAIATLTAGVVQAAEAATAAPAPAVAPTAS